MSSKMNLYCCGGAALNIGSQLVKYSNQKNNGFADLSTYFIDASRSNLGSEISNDIVYLVDGLDGSGKRRESNYPALTECSREILHLFKPADINVILHSASGGLYQAR